MKTYFRQIILNGFLIAAMNMMAGSSDALLAFSTKGPDYYADGTPVQEGECYALVWTRNGSEFAGVDLNGQVVDTVNNAVVVALPLAKAKSDGTVHCPTTLFQIDEAYAKAHAAGTFALILLDTRMGDNDGNLVATGALGQVNGWGFAAKSQVKAVAATPAAVPIADDAVCAKTDRTSAIPAGEDIPQPKITGITTNRSDVIDKEYTPYVGMATITILPRPVEVYADSAEKEYDGTALTASGYTIAEATGFVDGQGFAVVPMTADSILTKVGSVANTIDVYDTEHWTMKGGTKAQNYEFSAQPGTLRVVRSTTPPMIIDHEPHAKGWVHLAFKPHPMDEDDFKQWVADMSTKGKIRVKFGETRDTCDTCTPLAAELSDQHETSPEKVWIRVKLTNGVESVGYWRVCLAESDGGGATKARRAETGTDSVNVFGILKIESATTNTMISIPWTWYSAAETNAEHIPVRKLVKTTNLTTGDMLYASVDDGSTYAAWTLFDGVWQPCSTVKVDRNGTGWVKVVADEEENDVDYGRTRRVARGNALWVVRRKPVDTDGRPIPFWIYGQSVTTEVANIVFAPTGTQTVVSTMLGNPYARDVKLNALDFEGEIASGDRIWFYTPQGVMKTLKYVSGKGWRMATTKLVDGSPRTVYTYDVTIPAGLGFWYDRRGTTDLRVKWPRPEGRK